MLFGSLIVRLLSLVGLSLSLLKYLGDLYSFLVGIGLLG